MSSGLGGWRRADHIQSSMGFVVRCGTGTGRAMRRRTIIAEFGAAVLKALLAHGQEMALQVTVRTPRWPTDEVIE
jgi:hypothetical protein